MCGRYYIEIDESELQDIVNEVEKKTGEYQGELNLKTSGEIFPTDIVPVQTGINEYWPMKWGFVGYNGKPVINARSETALQKPMFKLSMQDRRCLIPASGYYEWKKDGSKKTKCRIYSPGEPMYLAGCYRKDKDSNLFNFVVLTRPADYGIENIHDRMPVIVPQTHIKTCLYESPDVIEYVIQDLRYGVA